MGQSAAEKTRGSLERYEAIETAPGPPEGVWRSPNRSSRNQSCFDICPFFVTTSCRSPSLFTTAWKLPTRHLDGDGRRRGMRRGCSPSGASSRDWRIPVDTLLQRANVGILGTRSKAHPPSNSPAPLSVHLLVGCAGLHHWWALYGGFMGTAEAMGSSDSSCIAASCLPPSGEEEAEWLY